MKDNILYIVIPCYNEEEVLEETSKRLKVNPKTIYLESRKSTDFASNIFAVAKELHKRGNTVYVMSAGGKFADVLTKYGTT